MDLIVQLDDISQQADRHFTGLHSAQINWKAEHDSWSIGQCLDHILVANTTYFNTFELVILGSYKLSFLQKINPFKKAFGPMMIKTLGPVPEKKFKAPKEFEPSKNIIRDTIVKDFLQHQEALKQLFNSLHQSGKLKNSIASPVSSMIIYSVEDAMKIITGHEQRHVNQAIGVLNHPNFPTS